MKRKPATRVFQHFSFRRHDHAEPIRRSVVTRPKVKRAEQEKCDSRRFAIACKPKACVPPQMGFAHLGSFAVGFLMCLHLSHTRNQRTLPQKKNTFFPESKYKIPHRGPLRAGSPAFGLLKAYVAFAPLASRPPAPRNQKRKGAIDDRTPSTRKSNDLVARQSLARLSPPLWVGPPPLRSSTFSVQPAHHTKRGRGTEA